MSVVVCEADQQRLLDAFLAAERAGQACAVLDAQWPSELRDTATALVEKADRAGDLGDDDLVLFTSGSSGRPRAVVRSRASWRASLEPFTAATALTGDDVVLLPGSLASTLFLWGAFHAHAVGASLRLRGESPWEATVAHAVPAAVPGLLADVRAGRAPRLRLLVVAGDRLGEVVRRDAHDAGVDVLEYYGAAELSFVGLRGDRGMRPFPGVEIEVRDGVLWSRSPYVSRGYLGRSGALQRDEAGWSSVGDLAVDRGDGTFDVLGRAQAAVNVGGHTVLVTDVEEALRALPGVDDVAVCGVPHARLGEALVALVAGPIEASELRRGSAALPRASRPRRFVPVEAIPRTPGGKIRRDAVRDLVLDPVGPRP